MEHNGFEFVDLGLPSGTKWATCNIGAENPWEYGKYFQWGDTVGHYDNEEFAYEWEHAPFNGGNISYNKDAFNAVKDTVCPNGILAPEYDAAHVNMGGDWHMPTREDIDELLDNTINEWIEDYEGTGVNGMLFTSRVDDSNRLFIPASGYRNGSFLFNVGYCSDVWCSSLYLNDWYYAVNFNNVDIRYDERYDGYSVRGVFNSK